MEGIRRALVLGPVLMARTAIEQAPSVGPIENDIRGSLARHEAKLHVIN